jgi:hypothetical protein
MTVAPALAVELWVSFVSLVRSYAGVAGLHGGVGVEVTAVQDSVVLSAGGVECLMQFAPENGAVVWSLREGVQEMAAGRFALLPDGRMEQDGQAQEMDSVAIDMVTRIRDRAGRVRAGQEERR